MAHVAGEGGHVVGGVGQLQHRLADDIARRLRGPKRTTSSHNGPAGDHRKLFDDDTN